jgi:hypothetical protein
MCTAVENLFQLKGLELALLDTIIFLTERAVELRRHVRKATKTREDTEEERPTSADP